jgi:hypothetical protein
MPTAATMLDSHPHLPELDTQVHADALDALWQAARTAAQCADACLHEPNDLRHCISSDLDVVDLATATAGMVVRTTEPAVLVEVLAACRSALRSCAQECRAHGSHLRHCALCADACERAEEHCHRLEVALRRLVDGAGTTPGGAGTAGAAGHVPHDLDITERREGRQPIHLISDGGPGDGAD